jgi:hypothetical protein
LGFAQKEIGCSGFSAGDKIITNNRDTVVDPGNGIWVIGLPPLGQTKVILFSVFPSDDPNIFVESV